MTTGRGTSPRSGARLRRGFAAFVLALLFLAQPLQALRLSCADVGRLFPERCCCKSVEAACCASDDGQAAPVGPRAEHRFDCECAIELPGTPPARPAPEPRADEQAPRVQLVSDARASIDVAEAWKRCGFRAPDSSARGRPPRGGCFARLPCGASSTIAELSVLGVARC